ncbi:hypothetical protein H1C71_000153 [Ictidomys tridecemlineatus]|nr:hypothetical protein H1C71_000153 [Ictidomys tridecemlineatus]KAG3263877.1 hypothetical protein H1C71_000153 [Ictidomys tridecemlineatus]KAG3263878.1 hypothetical protein H1C71_000153 [Ictidomys tridecemlineatus]KAG3263879.1 hypothetical protein H1C71_000153 [Ictidomys tridecemlineatus]KAG3263880.1 hypothetical protein H1C71_000153 [Ictidomys tridecemlineatus]
MWIHRRAPGEWADQTPQEDTGCKPGARSQRVGPGGHSPRTQPPELGETVRHLPGKPSGPGCFILQLRPTDRPPPTPGQQSWGQPPPHHPLAQCGTQCWRPLASVQCCSWTWRKETLSSHGLSVSGATEDDLSS